VNEVRGDDLRQYPPLVMRLAHETDVPQAEIAEPAVDELGRRARRCAAEVACVHERDPEAGACRVGSYPGSDDSAADDQ
jgi:hypothetical protein